jgi:hypothetical protein
VDRRSQRDEVFLARGLIEVAKYNRVRLRLGSPKGEATMPKTSREKLGSEMPVS